MLAKHQKRILLKVWLSPLRRGGERLFLIVLLLYCGLFVTVQALAETLVLSGSTTVQKRIIEPAAAAFESATGIHVHVLGVNSGRGFTDLIEGKVQASIASSSISMLLEKSGGIDDNGLYREHIIARDVIVPIVHKSNPIEKLTWQQLADIHTGRVRNWQELGGPNLRITVITSRPTAATRKVFQSIIMSNAPYVEGSREVKSTRQEVNLVAKFKGGIGAVSEGFVAMFPGKVKVIKTAPIARPLSLITRGDPTPMVQKTLDFLLTNEAKKYFK